MEKRTLGTIISVKRQWWLKVNTKSFRKGALDGATFPHIVKVRYVVDGREIVKRKWLDAWIPAPSVDEKVAVIYKENKPTRFKLEIF